MGLLTVSYVEPDLCAHHSGLRSGDTVLSVNGARVEAELDFVFHAASHIVHLEIERKGVRRTLEVSREMGGPLGVRFVPQPVCRCGNRCIFCFVDQMPPGLRKSLYIKDEDFRHSFLYGNYITLTTLGKRDISTIEGMALSPLYVSVHATDTAVRNRLLGNPRAPDIVKQLRELGKRGISCHTQIVVCPGYNDRAVLARSIRALLGLGRHILSIGVVPVGLTRFRTHPLAPVGAVEARDILERVERCNENEAAKGRKRRAYAADELFVKAGKALPPKSYYGEFPQLENGIGLLRQLKDEARKLCRSRTAPNRRARKALAVTGESAFRHVGRALAALTRAGLAGPVNLVPVRNDFLGHSVTVAGLLSGGDVVRALKNAGCASRDLVLVPSVMFNSRGYTLDGYSVARMRRMVGCRVEPVANLSECVDILTRRGKRT